MRLAIMQPYYFPYLGYFALMRAADEWVVFDVSQYTRKSWMNRNRVLHPTAGWTYVTAAVGHAPRETRTSEIKVLDMGATRAAVLGKIAHYRRAAPYYQDVRQLVEEAFEGLEGDSLVELNIRTMFAVCGRIGISLPMHIASDLPIDWSGVSHAGGWAPLIAMHLGATKYVNPISGRDLFRPDDFRAAHIVLEFLQLPPITYETAGYEFVPNLSVLDVLMWNRPEDVSEMLCRATIFDEVPPSDE